MNTTVDTMVVTNNGKKTTLVRIGNIIDYEPKSFYEDFKGSFMDDVWMDLETKEDYVQMTLYDGCLRRYDGKRKIKYIDSKFITVGQLFFHNWRSTDDNNELIYYYIRYWFDENHELQQEWVKKQRRKIRIVNDSPIREGEIPWEL